MELRVLRYFIEVARTQNITAAAERLHITQPTLSKQLMDLEDELGAKLFERGKRRTTLTEDGMLLFQRAKEIVALADLTESAFRSTDERIAGDIAIGCGETKGMRLLVDAMKEMRAAHPGVTFRLSSGNRRRARRLRAVCRRRGGRQIRLHQAAPLGRMGAADARRRRSCRARDRAPARP